MLGAIEDRSRKRTAARRQLLAGALTLAFVASITAQAPVHVKLATLAPENSPWQTALSDMGAAWTKATAGRVTVTVFAGSSIDSESSAVVKMNPTVNSLQAATLTISGLAEIDDAFNAFGMPFFFESDSELEAVQTALTPALSQRLDAKGYHLINWGNAGWVRLFSKTPIHTWADARQAKLYTTQGDSRTVQWYTQNGFHAIPLKQRDIATELKRPAGAIDAIPTSPYVALALQFYRDAPYMLDVRLAPLVTGTVVTNRVWGMISSDDRSRMLEIAAAAGRKIQAQSSTIDADAIREMQRSTTTADVPFQVITLDDEAATRFHAEADQLIASQRGTLIPADIFDAAVRERKAFRQVNQQRDAR